MGDVRHPAQLADRPAVGSDLEAITRTMWTPEMDG